MLHHFGPLWVEVDVEHDLKVIKVRVDDRRFETIHDNLASPLQPLIDDSGEHRVDQSKQVRQHLGVIASPGQVGMVRHEAIRIEAHSVAIFKLHQQIVVELLHGVGAHQPRLVVALPSDMKGTVVFENGVAGEGRHKSQIGKDLAKDF